jgi:hypothetical protein
VNAVPTPIMADQVGAAMRVLAAAVAGAHEDEIGEQDRVEIRLVMRAALDRVVADGYAYAGTVRRQGQQARQLRAVRLVCAVCPRLRPGRRCFACRREEARLEDLARSRAAEKDRLRFGRGL